MTESTAIQGQTKSFRDEVMTWSEKKLRETGAELGIPGSDTAPQVTLAEAIVQHERDQLRSDATGAPELPTSPRPARKGINRLNR